MDCRPDVTDDEELGLMTRMRTGVSSDIVILGLEGMSEWLTQRVSGRSRLWWMRERARRKKLHCEIVIASTVR